MIRRMYSVCVFRYKPTQFGLIDRANPEKRARSIDWAQPSWFIPEEGDGIRSPSRSVLTRNRAMNNVRKHNNFNFY